MSWNLSKERPIYIQLVEQIKLQILSGHYRPGERFPSVRELATEAAVNPRRMHCLPAQAKEGGFMILLESKHICKNFGPKPALRDINVTIECGKIIGLLGPNGSGKTTFLKLINGLLTPSSGELFIGGERPGVITKQHISYLPDQTIFPKWMKISDLFSYYDDFFVDFDKNKAEEMLKRLDIVENMRLKHMSKGTQEKVQLILTMSRNANLYCLDEPIGGVDPATRDYILQTIISNYSENASVLLSTHLISDVESILDDVIFLQDGQIRLQSSVDDIREQQGKSVDTLFREVFRC